ARPSAVRAASAHARRTARRPEPGAVVRKGDVRVYSPERLDHGASGGRSSRRRQKRSAGRQTWAAVGLAAISTLLPGVGHIWAGRRKSGIPILLGFLLLVGVGVFVATMVDRTQLLSLAVDTNILAGVIVAALLLAIGWSAVIVSAYHIRQPGSAS